MDAMPLALAGTPPLGPRCRNKKEAVFIKQMGCRMHAVPPEAPSQRHLPGGRLKDRPFYLGVQYHPEFKSRPIPPHPLFIGFVSAALDTL